MILFQQYTDVAAWQLFGGWILAPFLLVSCVLLWFLFRSSESHSRYWFKQWNMEWDKADAAIDKVKSLEARISCLTDRQRSKNGRFEAKKKG